MHCKKPLDPSHWTAPLPFCYVFWAIGDIISLMMPERDLKIIITYHFKGEKEKAHFGKCVRIL
jgi:hypothetical protein